MDDETATAATLDLADGDLRRRRRTVVKHYARFFAFISTPPGGAPAIDLTPQDQADMVAFLELLR